MPSDVTNVNGLDPFTYSFKSPGIDPEIVKSWKEYKMNELERRLSEATGPDRELNAAIEVAMFGGEVKPRDTIDRETGERGSLLIDIWRDGKFVQIGCAPYTASIDAALALVERLLPNRPTFSLDSATGNTWICELHWFINPARHVRADAKTAPLAILIALIRALATQEPTNGK